MDSTKLKLERRGILPGFADGRYESAPSYDASEFAKTPYEDPLRRDNRVNIRISGQDMTTLHRMALTEGLPLQSLLAQIVHLYANGHLQHQNKELQQTGLEQAEPAPLSNSVAGEQPGLSEF